MLSTNGVWILNDINKNIRNGDWILVNNPLAPGNLWGWGSNANGELGNGTSVGENVPTLMDSSLWKLIETTSTSSPTSMGIKDDGTLWAWGVNTNNIFGDGTSTNSSSPVQVSAASWSKISIEPAIGIGIKNDGTMWSWGSSTSGGLGTGINSQATPSQIGSDLWSDVSVGATHSAVAINQDGTLWGWGSNSYGELGLGNTTQQNTPTLINPDQWKSIGSAGTTGTAVMYGIKQDGTLWFSGTTTSTLTQVGTDSDWEKVVVAPTHSLMLKIDGTLWALGSGSASGPGGVKTVPTQIGTDNWLSISTGVSRSFGIQADSTLWAWGDSDAANGELGDGSNTSGSVTPIMIDSSPEWKSTSVGGTHSLAIR